MNDEEKERLTMEILGDACNTHIFKLKPKQIEENDYIRQLERAAERLEKAMEQALSVMDPHRTVLVPRDAAIDSCHDALRNYHRVMRDYCND